MDLKLGAPVVSVDGADLGKIDKVIFDPQGGETKAIVVRKGSILPRDVAIPIVNVRVAAPTRVELDLRGEQVNGLPEFVEADYAWPPTQWVAPYGWPAGGVMWPAAYLGGTADYPYPNPVVEVPEEVLEAQRRRDEENAVVGQGAEVTALGGEKVGSVQNVLVDPATQKASRIIVRRGLLFSEDVELPGEWVESFDDEHVMLNVDKVTVEQLAKHQK
jgi:uncharacterized protein YrrD